MLDNEKKLVQEITDLKAEIDKQSRDQYRHSESERENYKNKLQEADNKSKVFFLYRNQRIDATSWSSRTRSRRPSGTWSAISCSSRRAKFRIISTGLSARKNCY